MELTRVCLMIVSVLSMVDSDKQTDSEVCPKFKCPPEPIPPECRKMQFVIGSDGFTACRACDTSLCNITSCPQVMCPEIFIPQKCRKANYVIGADGITRCPVCDSNMCGDKRTVCPKLNCTVKVPPKCRVKQRTIGDDGLIFCQACHKNGCEDYLLP